MNAAASRNWGEKAGGEMGSPGRGAAPRAADDARERPARLSERIFQLPLCHFRAPLDSPGPRARIERVLRRTAVAGARTHRLAAPRGALRCVLSPHRAAALAAAAGTHAGFSLGLLLIGLAAYLLALGLVQMPAILAPAFVFGRAGLTQRDRDRLPPVLDLSAAAAAQFAMLEF